MSKCPTPVWCTDIWCIPFGACHMVHGQMVPRGTFSALGRMVPGRKVPKNAKWCTGPNGAQDIWCPRHLVPMYKNAGRKQSFY